MTQFPSDKTSIADLSIPLERDVFFRTLIRELSGTLQEVVGLEKPPDLLALLVKQWVSR